MYILLAEQMQHLSVARAVFLGSLVLLLDEAPRRQLLKYPHHMTGRTVVIVSHRKAVLSICNRVLKFTEDG